MDRIITLVKKNTLTVELTKQSSIVQPYDDTDIQEFIAEKTAFEDGKLRYNNNLTFDNDNDIPGIGEVKRLIDAGVTGLDTVSSSNIFLSNENSDISGYKKLKYTTDAVQETFESVVNGNEVLLNKFIYDSAIDLAEIITGVASFSIYSKIDSSNSDCYVKVVLFSRSVSTGIETELFNVSKAVTSTTYELLKFEYTIASNLVVDPLSRFGLAVYVGKTTASNSKTVTLAIGNGTASYFTLPIPASHDVLRRKNENLIYQHVDSTATKTTPIDADSVALWDSITSKFIRTTLTNFKTWIKSFTNYNSGIAGENITSGKPLIRKSDGLIYLANATTPATLGVVGFSTNSATIGESVTFQHSGYITLTNHGLTVGSINSVYVTTSSGGISNSRPSVNGNGIEAIATAKR
jgi:hypothetical protein